MLCRFLVEEIDHDRCRRHNFLHFRVLAVQNPQRILLKAPNTILIKLTFHAGKVFHEGFAVARPGLCRAQGVDLERQPGQAQGLPHAGAHDDELRIDVRALEAQRLNVELVELAVAAFLWLLVAEHRT